MTIRRLTAQDLDLYRSIRLRALRTDPAAFGSSFERERAFDDATWLARLTAFAGRPGVLYIEESDGRAVAIAGIGIAENDTTAMLWGMWVAPDARRNGSASRLIASAIDWAASRNLERVALAVEASNQAAIELYRSMGFVTDDLTQIDSTELIMVFQLTRSSDPTA